MLQFHWRTSLVSDLRYQSQTSTAIRLAELLLGVSEPPTLLHWVHLGIRDEDEDEPPTQPDSDYADDETCLLHDALGIICDQEGVTDHDHDNDAQSLLLPAAELSMILQELLLFDINLVSMN